ncbi:NTP transferase domain-containing protein [Pseudoduganella sp. FT25W]|uniref:NTP transferase domain-containing protein n=1 Tax=Duganella alba TaxID=2666081 RepID=A0A6L5QJM7_9BURK|nr:glycosyltransferase family 2 protein [Duganella alba]MRX09502.1 NTP transferase domain-containing protein [Duganella alba]MRX17601.1 NTP transferase domain-containing protein [Duganella alba]
MLNIVLPMAGHGSRFAKAGYTDPKPLIPVFGQPMIELVIENLRPAQPHRFIFVCQQEHLERYALGERLLQIAPGSAVIPVQQVTEGAACTVLLTRELIDNDQPLMIANCDQYIDVSIDDYLARQQGVDGLIMTMTADDPKWSFVRLNDNDEITEVVEKQVVSHEATVGIYNYARGSDFVAAADAMIAQDLRVNGEFYVAPAYNSMIAKGQKLAYYNIGADRAGMYGLGVPSDLDYFIAHCGELVARRSA